MYIEAAAWTRIGSRPTDRRVWLWWKRPSEIGRTFTKREIEAAYLKSQQMKIECYKIAQQALKKPFSV